ncbi:DUF5134 domain-containing protein [Streptomyces sp. GESEQ-4]|uniref:DUF5134 domain-containing protein n=1 Tax=Streptomyces sp. GESEQ-4 TaxID=2812655 RepID=UPI001FF08556|nr:DUF5134 domain-containing protein [Streptomyces sp. GESEQ-4]
MLTLLFVLVALHVLRRGVRAPGADSLDRVDHLLHFAMAAAMAIMPWSLGRSLTGRTTVVLCAAATLWFPLTALYRRATGTVAAIAGRLPPAAGMAAMAWMSRTPHGPAAGASMTAALVTTALTVCLLGFAVRSLMRPMPALRTAAGTAHRAAAADPYGHVRDGAMALGTAVMLVLPH